MRRQPLLVRERHLSEGRCAVSPRHRHRRQVRAECAAAVFNYLAAELTERFFTDVVDQPLDLIAGDQASGQPRALVKHPIARHPRSLGGSLGVVAEELIVGSNLAAGDVEAVLEARDWAERKAAGRAGADLDHVRHARDPADQLLFPEDRNDRLHVGVVDIADHRVVVAEDVSRLHARVLFKTFTDDVLDHVRHRVDVDDDSGRKRDRIALRRVEGECQLAEFLDDWGGRDVQRRLPRRHQSAAQPREDLLEQDRVAALERQLAGQARVGAGLGKLLLALSQQLLQRGHCRLVGICHLRRFSRLSRKGGRCGGGRAVPRAPAAPRRSSPALR
uniref:Unannotated protein n=1 Tax=freshwater metagenome TaxID=449393 RepID=A0A6J5ZDP6_9ZZZZ